MLHQFVNNYSRAVISPVRNLKEATSPSFKRSILYQINRGIMGIEQDIQQVKFRNEYQKAFINILYTHGWLSEKAKEFFADEDITPQQFNILRILRGSHPQPLSTLQIRERMLDKMSDTSRIVDRLITKGLVKKGTCKMDRRLVDITITDKGKKLLEKLDTRQDEMDNIINNLTPKEAAALSDLLDKIRKSNP
jgi:MarR family transcriptional regulator, 2-MHQ and catechol-resistance regulon repressor